MHWEVKQIAKPRLKVDDSVFATGTSGSLCLISSHCFTRIDSGPELEHLLRLVLPHRSDWRTGSKRVVRECIMTCWIASCKLRKETLQLSTHRSSWVLVSLSLFLRRIVSPLRILPLLQFRLTDVTTVANVSSCINDSCRIRDNSS